MFPYHKSQQSFSLFRKPWLDRLQKCLQLTKQKLISKIAFIVTFFVCPP
jgi:hypothetical protein